MMFRRRRQSDEGENLDRWLVSYADFITLMFAFFAVLYALSQSDKAKYQKVLEGIQRAFVSSNGVAPFKGTPFQPFEKSGQRPDNASPMVSDDNSDKLQENLRGLFEKTTGVGIPTSQLQVVRNSQGYKIRLGEVLLFKEGSSKIRRENIPFLYELGKRLSKVGVPIQVEGHSDTTKTSTKQSSWELSINRAYNVVQFFVEAAEFPQDKISLAGYGDASPLADNETAEGRAKNRRVEISLLTPDLNVVEMPW